MTEHAQNPVEEYLGSLSRGRVAEPLLPMIAAQAEQADRTRSIDPKVIDAIKRSDLMRLSATREIGGLEASIESIAGELEAISACCSSTSWVLWNHLCVFHFYCGVFGPKSKALLEEITRRQEWVSLPAGAGTAVVGRRDGDDWIVRGTAAFASGSRYGDWAGVIFAEEGVAPQSGRLHFGLVRTDDPGVEVEPTWKAMSLRASATDHIHYDEVRIPPLQQGEWIDEYRKIYRTPQYPAFSHRYREDWVAMSTLWLGAQAVGAAQAAIEEAAAGVRDRIAIFGVKMSERPMVQINLAQAAAKVATARCAVRSACAETDRRIESGICPTESDYLRQLSLPMMALELCDDAMKLVLRTLGGNGLREGTSFERRYRDIQAMPLHINAHRDRVSEQLGRQLLGLDTDNPF